MTERTLAATFQPLILGTDSEEYIMSPTAMTEYRNMGNTLSTMWMSESKLDLSGYQMKDLTVFFRSSFEQKGGPYTITWETDDAEHPVNPNELAVIEQVIISSVPFSDNQIRSTWIASPGFDQFPNAALTAGYEWGNFDRGHIIHGHFTYHGPNSQTAASYANNGYAIMTPLVSDYYSSLEPTTADALYCYRFFRMVGAPVESKSGGTGPVQFSAPALRVLMPIVTAEEPWLEYVMRQSRSYELANQV